MEQEILRKIEELEKKVEAVYQSSEKMRKYFLWTLIISAVVIILPLIGLLIVIPQFLNTYNAANLGL
jgi:type II secretory pathway component PulF